MKTSKTCYFPARDASTSRWESIAFSGLGLAGVVLITTAISNASHFAKEREGIVQTWSTSGWGSVELAVRSPDHVLTNLVRAQAATARTQAQVSVRALDSMSRGALISHGQINTAGATPKQNLETLQ